MVRVMYLIHVCYEAHISYNFRRANYILYMSFIDTMYQIYHTNPTNPIGIHYIIYRNKLYKIDSMNFLFFNIFVKYYNGNGLL